MRIREAGAKHLLGTAHEPIVREPNEEEFRIKLRKTTDLFKIRKRFGLFRDLVSSSNRNSAPSLHPNLIPNIPEIILHRLPILNRVPLARWCGGRRGHISHPDPSSPLFSLVSFQTLFLFRGQCLLHRFRFFGLFAVLLLRFGEFLGLFGVGGGAWGC